MRNILKLLVNLVLGCSLLWSSVLPINAATGAQLNPSGETVFPELETCNDCHVEENGRNGLTGTVLTVQETILYLIPIEDDFSIDLEAESLRLPISSGMSFEIAQTYKLVNGNSQVSSYGLLANTYGGKYLGILLLASNSAMNTIDYVKKNVRLSPVVTYIAGANDIYPNKVENILLALEQLSAYQDLRQGLKADKYISTLRAFGFYSYEAFHQYKLGALASGINAPAGGVCAPATGLASLAYLTEGAKIVDIVHHDREHLYFQGLFSPPAGEVDSGISIRPDGSFEELGFALPASGYFRVDTQVIPSGVAYAKTDPIGLQGLSDSILIFSISYSGKPMPEQAKTIADQLAVFQQFRSSGHTESLLEAGQAIPEPIQTSGVLLSNLQKLYTGSD